MTTNHQRSNNGMLQRMHSIAEQMGADGPEHVFEDSRPTQLSVGIIPDCEESSIFVLKSQTKPEHEASDGIAAAAYKPDKFWISKLTSVAQDLNISVKNPPLDIVMRVFMKRTLGELPHAPANVFIETPGSEDNRPLFQCAKSVAMDMWFKHGETRFFYPTRAEWTNYLGGTVNEGMMHNHFDMLANGIISNFKAENRNESVSALSKECIKMTYICYLRHTLAENTPRLKA